MDFSFQIIRILIVSLLSFGIAFFLFPFFINYFKKIKFGKRIERPESPIFEQLHKKKEGTPSLGGAVILLSVLAVLVIFELLANTFPTSIFSKITFLSRKETFLPLGLLLCASILGLTDDILGMLGIGKRKAGFRIREKLLLYFIPALVGSLWFYFKLEWDILKVPFLGNILISYFYIPFFILTVISTAFATNETDGLDGLAGGILITAFVSLAVIAFFEGKYDLTVFMGSIIGSLFAFLWYNIFPAKIFLGDTGAMGLGVLVGIIALLTNSALLLPFIFFIPLIESISVILQKVFKFITKRKLFLSSPLHHHFEALNHHESTITMRFWIIAWVFAGLGVILFIIS